MSRWTLTETIRGNSTRVPLEDLGGAGGNWSTKQNAEYVLKADDQAVDGDVQVRQQGQNLRVEVDGQVVLTLVDFFAPGASSTLQVALPFMVGEVASDDADAGDTQGVLWSHAGAGAESNADWLAWASLLAVAGAGAYVIEDDDDSDPVFVPPGAPDDTPDDMPDDTPDTPDDTPDAPTELPVLALQLQTDSGVPDDLVTNVGTVELIDATLVVPEASLQYSTDGGNTWVDSFAAVEGANGVQVRQADSNGNTSAASPILEFTLDTMIETPVLSLQNGFGVGNPPTANRPAFALSGLETGAVLEFRIDGGEWMIMNGVDDLGAAFLSVADGQYLLEVRQTDIAGNTSGAAGLEFILDSSVLLLPQILIVPAEDTGESDRDFYTSNGALQLVRPDILWPDAVVQWSTDGGTTWNDGLDTFVAAEGENTVLARQIVRFEDGSLFGVGIQTELVFTFDSQVRVLELAADLDANGFPVISNVEDDAVVEYRVNYSGSDPNEGWSREYVPQEGTMLLEVRQIDLAGNISAAASRTFDFTTPVPPAEQVVVFNLSDIYSPDSNTQYLEGGVSSEYLGQRTFDVRVEYWIYIVVDEANFTKDAQSRLLAFDMLEGNTWSGGENLGADDHIVLISSDGSPVQGWGRSGITGAVFTAGEQAAWLTAAGGSRPSAAALNGGGLFRRFYDNDINSLDLWAGNAVWTGAQRPQLDYSSYWVDLQAGEDRSVDGNVTDDRNFTLFENPGNPLGDGWNVWFSLTPNDPNSWVDNFDELSLDRTADVHDIWMVQRSVDGFESRPILYRVEIDQNVNAESRVVVFDLLQGSSSVDTDGNREFDLGVTYNVYIVIDAEGDGTAPFQLNSAEKWSGTDNLGDDDKVILISSDGAPIIGSRGGHIGSNVFLSQSGPISSWYVNWGTFSSPAARLDYLGNLQRYTGGGGTSPVELFATPLHVFFTQVDTNNGSPQIDVSQYWIERELFLRGDELDNIDAATDIAPAAVLPAGFEGWQVQFSANGESGWSSDSASHDEVIAGLLSGGSFGDDISVHVRLHNPDTGTNTPSLQVGFQLNETVNFDLVDGTSSAGVSGSRTFDADTTYTIFVVVDPESNAVSLDAGQQWTGADKLGADDTIVLISNDESLSVQGFGGGTITSAGFAAGSPAGLQWRTNSGSLDLAGFLVSSGGFVRRHSDRSSFVDLWTNTAPLPAMQIGYSNYTHYRTTLGVT